MKTNFTIISKLIFVLFLFISVNSGITSNLAPSDSYCKFLITKGNKPVKNARVVGDVCGGISCSGQTKPSYTDKDGYATISFSEGCKLCAVFINGKEYEGTFKNGNSYTISLD